MLLPVLLLTLVTLGCGGGGAPHVPSGLDYVLAPEQPHYGASFAVWSQRWWQWCYELPRTNHPLFEATGDHVALGQVDPVWFIGGEMGSLFTPSDGVAERTVEIPSGIALFFPILNVSWTNQECVDPDTTYTYTELRQLAADAIENTMDLICEVDGTRVLDAATLADASRFRAQAEQFSYWLPADNIYVDICGDAAVVTLHDPVASDGTWMMLRPMPPGEHTVHWEGRFGTLGSTVSATYHITVLP